MVVHQVDPWISGRDIDPGQRWALALGRELAQSDFAVICLTAENTRSPWILFEAGAVARSLEARVVPLLFGIQASQLDGPLSQFQSVQSDRAGIERLVSILYDVGKSGLEASQRDLVFKQLWPVLEERLETLIDQARTAAVVESPTDLIAELAESPERRPASMLTDKDMLERLDQEKKRLRRELDYLEAEEAKLTQQDAPISLVERAIEPTEHRLATVESTVGRVLDQTFSLLTPSQIEILRNLVTPSGVRLVQPPNEDRKRQADVNALTRLGLLAVGDHGAEIVHDLVAHYVAKKFQIA